jgi:hypothetical protein
MPQILKTAGIMKKVKMVEGRPMRRGLPSTDIKKVKESLVKNKILPPSCANRPTNLQESADDLLFGLNITIDKESSREFSLLATETDTEVIENPNIIDTIKWEELKNTNILAIDKFPEATDNFFVMDRALPTNEKRKRNKVITAPAKVVQSPANIASDLITYNIKNISTGRLPQFKK